MPGPFGLPESTICSKPFRGPPVLLATEKFTKPLLVSTEVMVTNEVRLLTAQLQPVGLFTLMEPIPPCIKKTKLIGDAERSEQDGLRLMLEDEEPVAVIPEHNTAVKSTRDIRKVLVAPNVMISSFDFVKPSRVRQVWLLSA